MYQFNQTLAEMLKAADDDVISIEGIVEDIEVASYSGTKAIQCKYHETQNKYTPSVLYHPLLQMMKHFKSNPSAKINYHLFVHFPNESTISITSPQLEEALKSENKDLKDLVAEANGVDVKEFLKTFSVTVTPKYDDLTKQNHQLLEAHGLDKGEVETIFFPNAIQIIADLSIKHDADLRKISKKDFLESLRRIRSTAISRWTLALKTREKILETRRRQLAENLRLNARLRHLILFPSFLEGFSDQVVLFIKSYTDRYHHKAAHTHTPTFVIDVPRDELDDIGERLIARDITPNLGRPIKSFSETHFFREPLVVKDKREFLLRLIRWDDYKNLKAKQKPDDLFVIGRGDIDIDTKDVNLEVLAAERLDEIKYMMRMSNAY